MPTNSVPLDNLTDLNLLLKEAIEDIDAGNDQKALVRAEIVKAAAFVRIAKSLGRLVEFTGLPDGGTLDRYVQHVLDELKK